ncbi:MAG: non-hydrolyzing UDP-N-acetylglucosamine 2-epimerase [Nitrospiria bacterium]
MKILTVVGARPQFIKAAPVSRAIEEHNRKIPHHGSQIIEVLVHTGQHYDDNMNGIFFRDLNLAKPDYNLEVGSGLHGEQTGEMLKKIETVLIKEQPDYVLVYGDTNSTLAGALAAAKLHIPVAHVEAGLRSFNRRMPEETNRVMTDHISSLLFCPTEAAVKNLQKEGFTHILNEGKRIEDFSPLRITDHSSLVVNVGDVMYDVLLHNIQIAEKQSTVLETFGLKADHASPITQYYLATVHRPENTDDPERLFAIVEIFREISKKYPVIWPIHPRTRRMLESHHRSPITDHSLHLIDPVSYLDMLILEKNAKVILTDSGGVQKEACWFQVPCVTLREETEWVETVESGCNHLSGTDMKRIPEVLSRLNEGQLQQTGQPSGEGHAAKCIVKLLFLYIKKMWKMTVEND